MNTKSSCPGAQLSQPGIAVLIRTLNSARTLPRCLDNLYDQTAKPNQVIVVDSGSTDDTLTIAADRACKIVHYPEDKPFNYSAAINQGMEAADHPLVLILSSHVYLPLSHTLESLRSLLVVHEDACAASICREIAGANTPRMQGGQLTDHLDWTSVSHQDFVENYPFGAISNSCNMIWTTDWAARPFNPDIPRCEDQEWLLGMLKRGRTAIRVVSPPIIYDNPYHSYKKEISDLITLAQWEISPSLTNRDHLLDIVRRVLGAIWHMDWDRARRNVRLLIGLLGVKLGRYAPISSGYV